LVPLACTSLYPNFCESLISKVTFCILRRFDSTPSHYLAIRNGISLMTHYTAILKHHTMAPTISQNDKERKKSRSS
jgi:hypothetical protein